MKKIIFSLFTLLFIVFITSFIADNVNSSIQNDQKMTNEYLEKIIQKIGTNVNGKMGIWQFQYQKRDIMVITDASHNRMRIMTPVIEEKKLKKNQLSEMLYANFDRVPDVRYAISNDIVWSCFIHPLGELNESQVTDAIKQVTKAANTFGTSYSSTDLVFGGGK